MVFSSWCGWTPSPTLQRALRVEVDQQHPAAELGQRGAEVDRRGGLADSALLVAQRDDPGRAVLADRLLAAATRGAVGSWPDRRPDRFGHRLTGLDGQRFERLASPRLSRWHRLRSGAVGPIGVGQCHRTARPSPPVPGSIGGYRTRQALPGRHARAERLKTGRSVDPPLVLSPRWTGWAWRSAVCPNRGSSQAGSACQSGWDRHPESDGSAVGRSCWSSGAVTALPRLGDRDGSPRLSSVISALRPSV